MIGVYVEDRKCTGYVVSLEYIVLSASIRVYIGDLHVVYLETALLANPYVSLRDQ